MAVLIPERHRGQHRRTHDRAVQKIVKCIAHDDERRRGAVHVTFVRVAMPEQNELFENEEREDPREAASRGPVASR